MSEVLITRMRKQRELKISVGKFTFLARRPTDVEALEIHQSGGKLSDVAVRFVHGWENVTEDDIVGGGIQTAVPFSPELWREWCNDRPDFWATIATAIMESYELHAKEIQAAGKK